MRTRVCGELKTSVLGFGCGSVLGRVGRAASLRAMHVAWDAGITLFDTARSYGYGEAEAVLGEFLRGKRERAIVATKYGIAPQRLGALKRIAVPVARAALRVPGVRGLKRGGGGVREVQAGQFSGEGLRASVETSLRELRTDRVDVLYLHEATAEVVGDEELMAALDELVRAGKILRAGLYASAGVAVEALKHWRAPLSAVQFGGDLTDPVAGTLMERGADGLFVVANHPFGGAERVARIGRVLAAMSSDVSVPLELREKLKGIDGQGILEAIMGAILSGAGVHALVFSMMEEAHVRANVRAVEGGWFTEAELVQMRARLMNVGPD